MSLGLHKKIGIIGGLSPESTVTYYLHITRKYVEIYGDCSYPEIIIYSVNLENYHLWRSEDRWDLIAHDLIQITSKLEEAGAEICAIATNTMHLVYDEVQASAGVPFIHIADPLAEKIAGSGLSTVGLMGTKFTMEESFYRDRLKSSGIDVIVPDQDDRDLIHRVIEDELVKGVFSGESRRKYLEIAERLRASGAEGIVLGCTEIPLLLEGIESQIPFFDTALIHAEALLDYALNR